MTIDSSRPYIAALDVGGKRIGVALAHRQAALPSPHSTLINDEHFWDNLSALIEKEQVGELVVGLPRGLDGQETAQTSSVRVFMDELERRVDLPTHWQDEAVTSIQAKDELRQARKEHTGYNPKKGYTLQGGYNKGLVDAQAAAIILQDYLNSMEREP